MQTININLGHTVNKETWHTIDQVFLETVVQAHQNSALINQNASSASFLGTLYSSGSVINAIAAAVLSVGQRHAPVSEARSVYESWTKEQIEEAITTKNIIPGFGNSFFRDSIDPSWSPVHEYIQIFYPRVYERINTLTEEITKAREGKKLWPNAALYTAALCSQLGFQHGTESMLFVMSRLPIWFTKALETGTK